MTPFVRFVLIAGGVAFVALLAGCAGGQSSSSGGGGGSITMYGTIDEGVSVRK